MSARDGLLAGGVGSVFAVLADLLINGGEIILTIVLVAAEQSGLVYLLLSRLVAAAPNVSWLPAAEIRTAFTVVSLLLALVALIQLVRRSRRSLSERL